MAISQKMNIHHYIEFLCFQLEKLIPILTFIMEMGGN